LSTPRMDQYKVTVLGARKVGKTSLVHFMTNMSKHGGAYHPTVKPEFRHMKLDHPDEEIGPCSVAIEDTPGFKALDRASSAPELLEPKMMYVYCEDGVRKPGAEEDANAQAEEPTDEKTPLVAELKAVSPIDSNLDRQGFIVVYNPMDKDTFKAAQDLIQDLQDKMKKPEDEEESSDATPPAEADEPPEIPPHPIVVVATFDDLKRKEKNKKTIVTKEEGEEMAGGAGAPHFEINSRGKNVAKVLRAVISAVHKVETNLVFDKEPTWWEKNCAGCTKCVSTVTCGYNIGCAVGARGRTF